MKRLPAPSTATPSGRRNFIATAGSLSPLKPGSPVPAKVVMVPEGSTRRIRWFQESAMKRFPVVPTANPAGLHSRATAAGPLSPLKPGSPVPAKVVMVPEGSTRRMRLFPKSAMKRLPAASTATSEGRFNCASAAGPSSPISSGPKSILPGPAKVVMVPEGSTRRIRLFQVSAMNRLPAPSTATPSGTFNCASAAGPLSPLKPGSPVPAKVVMVPEGSTRRMRWLVVSAMKRLPAPSTATPRRTLSCASNRWAAVPAEARPSGACDGGDGPCRVHLANSAVAIGDEKVACAIDRNR